jgi:hypothetical protein
MLKYQTLTDLPRDSHYLELRIDTRHMHLILVRSATSKHNGCVPRHSLRLGYVALGSKRSFS